MLALAIGTLILALLGGCGGGDDSGSTAAAAGSSPGTGAEGGSSGEGQGGSQAQGGENQGANAQSGSGGVPQGDFVAEADAICGRVGDELSKALEKEVEGNVGKIAEAGPTERLVNDLWTPMLEGEIDELEALEGPPGAEKGLSEIIAAVEDVMAEAQEDPQAFAVQGYAFAKPEYIGRALGYKSCGGAR